jgi:serine/threonine-protein kinase RsbW
MKEADDVGENHPDVELRIPADSAYLAVLRTATAGLAARLDFTLDDIEDLRIAVDEACAMVLPQARENSDLTCTFDLAASKLTVAVTAECDSPRPPNRDGFAWTVLAALTNEVAAAVDGDKLTVTLARGTSDPE